MSKRNEVQVFQRAIAIPGVRVSRTGLVFERLDEESLVAAGSFLQAVDAYSAWWWGDLLAAYCGYNVERDEREAGSKYDEITRGEKLKQYAARYSAICGKEPKTLWHWKACADFYNSSRRREELSWSHHMEAMEGSDGDAAVADNWLDMAIANHWSRSELRAAIRRSKRAATEPEEPMPQLVLPMEVVECRRYATAALTRVHAMERSEAEALLAELAPVLALANALAQRVKQEEAA